MTRPGRADQGGRDALLRSENEELRARLAEAEETLQAIRGGDVDAIVVGERVYLLSSSGAAAERFRGSALAQVADAVIALDREFRVTWLNAAAERQFGVPSAEALGRRLRDVYTQSWLRAEDEAEALRALRETGEWRAEGTHLTRGGAALHVESTLAAHGEPGDRAGLLAIVRDVTVRRRAEETLHEAARQKDQFIAVLAHELRNPLAPIRTSVALLRARAPADPLLAHCHEVIDRQAAHMGRLLDDLLDVSRLARGKLTLQRAPVVLREAIDTAIDVCRPLVEQHQHTLSLDWRAGSVVIDADAERLVQVIGNLLTNAAKYTPRGGTIDVSVRSAGEEVLITVRDSGIGIDPTMLDAIFGLFAQGDDPPEQGGGGLGIGLALARRLVEMHGGTLRATSAGRGRGSEFVARLPVGQVSEKASRRPAPLAADGSWRHKRVLVIDDNMDGAVMLSLLFERLGAEVRVTHDGESALREAEGFEPQVVLLDLGMPRMDGYEVCRRMRQQPWGARITIVALTGWGQDEDRRRTAEAGFDAHVVKPVDPALLVERLRAIESRPARGEEDDAPRAATSGPAP